MQSYYRYHIRLLLTLFWRDDQNTFCSENMKLPPVSCQY